jgi:iron(III) transport system ATP-binding protein
VADTHYHRVVFFDDNGAVLKILGGEGTGPGQFLFPVAICQDDSEHFYVCEYGGDHRVQKFTRDGEHVLTFGTFGTAPGQFQRPSGIVWHDGRLYIADAINNRVQAFSDEGKFLEILGESGKGLSLEYPYDITLDRESEKLYVVEYGAGRVTKIDLAGRVLGRHGQTSRGEGGFLKPWGLAIDSQQRLRIADTENHRIVELKL